MFRHGLNHNHFVVIWPPLSPDLPSLDFYLWGYVKDSYQEKLLARDEGLRCIMDGAALMPNNNGNMQKATRVILK
jgi:hypothetical protein